MDIFSYLISSYLFRNMGKKLPDCYSGSFYKRQDVKEVKK